MCLVTAGISSRKGDEENDGFGKGERLFFYHKPRAQKEKDLPFVFMLFDATGNRRNDVCWVPELGMP